MKIAYVIAAALLMSACTATHSTKPTTTTQSAAMPTTQKTITFVSAYGFDETVHRLKSAINDKGMTVFATIDHQQAAKNHNITMQPATVLIFGNPKVGSPLMIKDPAFALQLPLKVLITQTDGQVKVIYTPIDTLIDGTNITPQDVANTLANAQKLIQTTVK